jgi:serine/threonine protein phosphatase PrpC
MHMEDRVSVQLYADHSASVVRPCVTPLSVFAVFDGHGGSLASTFLQRELLDRIAALYHEYATRPCSSSAVCDIAALVRRSIDECSVRFRESYSRTGFFQGSTIVLALLHGDTVWLCNVGGMSHSFPQV